MISAIIVILVIAGLAYAGTIISNYPGYVEIGLASGNFQMPIWYFLIALIAGVIIAMIVFKIIWTVFRLPSIGKRFGKNRRTKRSGDLLQKGMLAMGKGQWKKAEKILAKGARVSNKSKHDTGLFLSIAAQAAQEQGSSERRDQYLLEARQLAAEGQDTFTAAVAEAELHLAADAPKQALAILQQHHGMHYENPRLQKLEMQAYEQLDKHEEVWRLLKSNKKLFVSKAQFKARQIEVANALFSSTESTLETIEGVWSELPKADKTDEVTLLNYVSALVAHQQNDKAEKVLSKAIKKDYSDALIDAYSQLDAGSARDRLAKYSGWLRARPDNAYLNYGAAKQSYQLEAFEQAKQYAEKAIKARPFPEALGLLGKVYEALGQESNALQAYRTSVDMLAVDGIPALSGEILSAPVEMKALTDASKQTNEPKEEEPKPIEGALVESETAKV